MNRGTHRPHENDPGGSRNRAAGRSGLISRQPEGEFPRFRVRRVFRASNRIVSASVGVILLGCLLISCGREPHRAIEETTDPHLATNGTVEVTAKLVEIPDGAIFKRDLYDYATILKYQVVKVHRGTVSGETLYVGHYNPWKPRAEAADKRVQGIGGTVQIFRAGDTHRMALAAPIDDHFMGGIVNKYFGQTTNLLCWAVWTNHEEH